MTTKLPPETQLLVERQVRAQVSRYLAIAAPLLGLIGYLLHGWVDSRAQDLVDEQMQHINETRDQMNQAVGEIRTVHQEISDSKSAAVTEINDAKTAGLEQINNELSDFERERLATAAKLASYDEKIATFERDANRLFTKADELLRTYRLQLAELELPDSRRIVADSPSGTRPSSALFTPTTTSKPILGAAQNTTSSDPIPGARNSATAPDISGVTTRDLIG